MYFSLKDENYISRQGFWIYIKDGDVIVRRFSKEISHFENLPESEAVCYQEGVRMMDFDSNLGVYPF